MENKIKMVCIKCGYNWSTKSKLKKVTCPSCSIKMDKIKNA